MNLQRRRTGNPNTENRNTPKPLCQLVTNPPLTTVRSDCFLVSGISPTTPPRTPLTSPTPTLMKPLGKWNSKSTKRIPLKTGKNNSNCRLRRLPHKKTKLLLNPLRKGSSWTLSPIPKPKPYTWPSLLQPVSCLDLLFPLHLFWLNMVRNARHRQRWVMKILSEQRKCLRRTPPMTRTNKTELMDLQGILEF